MSIRLSPLRATSTVLVASLVVAAPVRAQDSRRSLDLAVDHVGLSIGDSRELTGVRLNFRDTRLERVDGLNLTVWKPAKSSHGIVRGLAIGVPYAGAERIHGLAVAAVGIETQKSLRGISVSGIGAGAGEEMSGIHLAGIGLGGGGNVRGLGVGGIGIGAGGSLRGIMVGGIGAGVGGDVRGLVIGGIGVGAGGRLEGIGIGGIGVGSGGGGRGLLIGGIGVGTGGDFDGIAIGGIGAGAGGTLRGLVIGGVGVGAPTLHGVGIGGIGVGGKEMRGAFLSAGTIKVNDGGYLRGLAITTYNDARNASQHGLMIAVVNIAQELHGVQLGVLNIVRRNPSGRKVLPVINWNFSK